MRFLYFNSNARSTAIRSCGDSSRTDGHSKGGLPLSTYTRALLLLFLFDRNSRVTMGQPGVGIVHASTCTCAHMENQNLLRVTGVSDADGVRCGVVNVVDVALRKFLEPEENMHAYSAFCDQSAQAAIKQINDSRSGKNGSAWLGSGGAYSSRYKHQKQ